MAKVNFGTTINDARGKIAGIVMSKNKSGSYVRTKVTPINPRTPAQQQVRSNFANGAKAWSGTLSAASRAAWVTFANTYPRRDIFGNSITLNGLNMYLSLNMVLNQLGVGSAAVPPATSAITPATWAPAWAVLSATAMTFNELTDSPDAAPYNYLFATRPLPPGRKATPSDYRFIYAAADPGVSGTVSVFNEYQAVFAAPVPGLAVFGLIATADSVSGLLSVSQPISGIVT